MSPRSLGDCPRRGGRPSSFACSIELSCTASRLDSCPLVLSRPRGAAPRAVSARLRLPPVPSSTSKVKLTSSAGPLPPSVACRRRHRCCCCCCSSCAKSTCLCIPLPLPFRRLSSSTAAPVRGEASRWSARLCWEGNLAPSPRSARLPPSSPLFAPVMLLQCVAPVRQDGALPPLVATPWPDAA